MTPNRAADGFTLAELLVACTLAAIVMGGVVVAFQSTVRLWRLGEANLQTYQDARTSFSILTRELNSIAPRSSHLIQGANDELEFVAVAPPMDVEEDTEPRLLWVHYRLKRDASTPGKVLLREERICEGAIPQFDEGARGRYPSLELGRKQQFEIASNVHDFDVQYLWFPDPEDDRPETDRSKPGTRTPVVLKELKQGTGLPHAMRISLTLNDAGSETGKTTFENLVVFRLPVAYLNSGHEASFERASTGASQ